MKKTMTSRRLISLRAKKVTARVNEWKARVKRMHTKAIDEYDKGAGGDGQSIRSLIDLIEGLFAAWFEPKSNLTLTPDRLDYLERVLDELENLPEDQETPFATRLHNILLQCNFNARSYCQAYIVTICDRIKNKRTLEEKVDALYLQQKIIAQLRFERGMKYYDLYPSVKEFIGGWLTEEINFVERKLDRIRQAEDTSSDEYLESGRSAKLLLNMSVANLACLMRAFVGLGIIRNDNVTELSNIMARTFVSKRSENLSARSFRLRYYDIEDAAKSAVTAMLKDTAQYLKELET